MESVIGNLVSWVVVLLVFLFLLYAAKATYGLIKSAFSKHRK